MPQDILFKTDTFVFSYRVAGLLVHDGRILLQKPIDDSAYAFPGGHVSFGETNEETLIREFQEEIGASIRVDSLAWVGELFFPWGRRPCHQICLYYCVSLKDDTSIPLNGSFIGAEYLEQKSSKLGFHWIDIKSLYDIELYPPQSKEYLNDPSNKIRHFVYRE